MASVTKTISFVWEESAPSSVVVLYPPVQSLYVGGEGNTAPWLADNQSRDLNNEFWLVVYFVLSVPDLNRCKVEEYGGEITELS